MSSSSMKRSNSARPRPAKIDFRLEVPIAPDWQNVDLLRMAILNCLAAAFADPGLGDVVSIITSELLENGIKYGDWSRGDALLLLVSGDARAIAIEVASPVTEGSSHYASVREMIEWIGSFPSARDAYVARMRAIAGAPTEGFSRMGLVRVACEGPCRLDAQLHDDGMLHVRATLVNDEAAAA
jgi:hypothetical protein